MSNKFMLKGVCPVCGSMKVSYNPALSMNTNIIAAEKERERSEKYPSSVWKCYHNGTPFHDNKNFSAGAGSDVPMHMFFQESRNRVYPDASDDCNKRHWKVKP